MITDMHYIYTPSASSWRVTWRLLPWLLHIPGYLFLSGFSAETVPSERSLAILLWYCLVHPVKPNRLLLPSEPKRRQTVIYSACDPFNKMNYRSEARKYTHVIYTASNSAKHSYWIKPCSIFSYFSLQTSELQMGLYNKDSYNFIHMVLTLCYSMVGVSLYRELRRRKKALEKKLLARIYRTI